MASVEIFTPWLRDLLDVMRDAAGISVEQVPDSHRLRLVRDGEQVAEFEDRDGDQDEIFALLRNSGCDSLPMYEVTAHVAQVSFEHPHLGFSKTEALSKSVCAKIRRELARPKDDEADALPTKPPTEEDADA